MSFILQPQAGGLDWATAQTSGFTAQSGNGYPCNTTAAGFTVLLPAAPAPGDVVVLVDYAGTWNTNNLKVDPNGKKLNGVANFGLLSTQRGAVDLVYLDSTQGWVGYASNGTTNFIQSPPSLDYLIVGGGGGGAGGSGGGGGGAGGYLTQTGYLINKGTSYTVTVGALGSAGPVFGYNGGNGSNSIFGSGSTVTTAATSGSITAIGGGGGGSGYNNGQNGGSGGGASGRPSGAPPSGGTATAGQGNNGGNAFVQIFVLPAGGGGGAGSAGGTASTNQGGNGGNGLTSSITGAAVTYAGGGGGGLDNLSTAGTGGTGGGGNGGINTGTGANATGYGSGGGGGGGFNTSGGNGSNGVVILVYPDTYPPPASIGVGLTYDQPVLAGYRVYRFTAGTGTINW